MELVYSIRQKGRNINIFAILFNLLLNLLIFCLSANMNVSHNLNKMSTYSGTLRRKIANHANIKFDIMRLEEIKGDSNAKNKEREHLSGVQEKNILISALGIMTSLIA